MANLFGPQLQRVPRANEFAQASLSGCLTSFIMQQSLAIVRSSVLPDRTEAGRLRHLGALVSQIQGGLRG